MSMRSSNGSMMVGQRRCRRVAITIAVAVAAMLSGAALVAADPKEAELATQTAVLTDGSRFDGALAGLDDKGFKFQTTDGERIVSRDQLVRWGTPAEFAAGPLIALADHGAIVAAPERIENDAIRARSPLFGDLELPVENVAALILRLPADHRAADGLLAQLIGLAAESDAVLLANGDELTGTLERLDGESLVLKTDIGDVTVERGQLQGVGFDASLAAKPSTAPAFMLVGFRDGSLVRTQELTIADGQLKLAAPSGASWTAPAAELVFVQALGGQVQYLSDLEVAEFRHLPFLTEAWSYGRDHNVTGARLRSGGQLYPKGLGVHSAANLSYRLDGEFRRFEAEVALDDHVGREGSVTFRVYVDGEQRFDSGLVRGGDPPKAVSVDLAGAKVLSLIVGYGERGDVLDRANWLDARLVK